MDINKVQTIIRGLGARNIVTKGDKVTCSCLLASWTHARGRDTTPSMVIMKGRHGDPIYSCSACHRKGSLRDLLCFIWHKTRVSTFRYIELLDGEISDVDVSKTHNPELYSQKKRVLNISKEDVDKLFVVGRIRESGDGLAWHARGALEQAAKVEEIPWSSYEPFVGSVPGYAIERGLTVDTCRDWELGHDRRMRRLLFPMRDRDQRLVAISGRRYACQWCGSKRTSRDNQCISCRRRESHEVEICSVCGEPTSDEERCAGCGRTMSPKYLHSDGFKRNLHLYGENRVQDGREVVYVVEGHLDALMLWQCGYRPVVALLGASPGAVQIEKLVAYYEKVIVVPDGDQAGKKMAEDIKAGIAWRIPVFSRVPADGCDPSGLGCEGLKKLLGGPGV